MSAINLGLHSKAGHTPVKERVSMEYLPAERPRLWLWALFAVFVAAVIVMHAIPSGPPQPPSPSELERKLLNLRMG